VKSDLQSLQGCRKILSLEIDGQILNADSLGAAKLTIRGNQFVSTGMGAIYEGTIEIDSGAVPGTLGMMFTNCPETGNTNFGMYKLSGERWRIYLATRGAIRPKEFVAVKGSGIAVELLERESEVAG